MRDTGPGIPIDQQEHLFKPFTQADARLSREYGGVGLGLTIASNLVELLGGKLWVESDAGTGSDFIFNLNLGMARSNQNAETLSREKIIGANILILLGNEVAESQFRNISKEWNFHLRPTKNFIDCLNFLREAKSNSKKYDVLIIDYKFFEGQLKDSNHEYIKQITDFGVPIISLCFPGQDLDESDFTSLRNFSSLVKPIRYSELAAMLHMKITGGAYVVDNEISRHGGRFVKYSLPFHKILVAEDNHINQDVINALSVRTLLSSRSSVQKPQGISRAILEDSVPPKIWLGDLNLIIENQEEKAYGEKICRYLESSMRLEDWLAAASFGFFDFIFTLPKIPDNYSSTPFEIISNLGFFPADLNNSYFFSSLSIMTDNFQISKFKNTAQTGIKNAIFRDLLRSISKKHFDSSDFIRQFSYKKFWDPSSDEKNTELIKQLNQIKLSSN